MLQERSKAAGTEASSSGTAKKAHRRKFSEPFKRKVLAYAKNHTVQKAADKYGVVNSVIYGWMKSGGSYGPRNKPRADQQPKGVTRSQYLIAIKLKRELSRRLRESGELDDFGMYVHILLKEILG